MSETPVRSNEDWPSEIAFHVDNSEDATGPEQSPEAFEFDRQMQLPLLERHEKGYWVSDSEKLEFLFQVAVKADKLIQEVGPQLLPMLEGISKNPMLKMFLPRG